MSNGLLTISPQGFSMHTVLFPFATSIPTLIIITSYNLGKFLLAISKTIHTYYDSV